MVGQGGISIAHDHTSAAQRFAVGELAEALESAGWRVASPSIREVGDDAEVVATVGQDDALGPEGYRIARIACGQSGGAPGLRVAGGGEAGAMYGLLDLAEQVRMTGGLEGVAERLARPRFDLRAVKINLPWSPYRAGPATDVHVETCRDLGFWRRLLDMMAACRFNALTLWNLHPFPYMIHPRGYEEACDLSDAELDRWRCFWRGLFRMARRRCIETYVVNWNIVVSPAFARAHGLKERNDLSSLVRRYTRQCVTQVIDEYPDLTGLGVTLADWMNDMTPAQREDWLRETFLAGMRDAGRPVKFIHRSVLAGSPDEMRRWIDEADLPDPVWVEVKFNWSHGHSTPALAITHDYNTGRVDPAFWDPPPDNYRIAWMIRNEDFFILRWGEGGFIRDHIAANGQPYVGGYFVGSEGYIPAADYSHNDGPHRTWLYAFQKQWLFYMLWGRLLYDPRTPDAVFAAELERRFGPGVGEAMLRAYTLASRVPLRLASFHAATWDFTLYSEGFLASAASRGLHDGLSPFISIDELIDHQTLDPAYLSIPDYVSLLAAGQAVPADRVSPLQLADASGSDSRTVLELIDTLRAEDVAHPGDFQCELLDFAAWAHLGLYLADKLRAGVALETFRRTGQAQEKTRAVELLTQAAGHWRRLAQVTGSHYRPCPYVAGTGFSWSTYLPETQRDIELAEAATPRPDGARDGKPTVQD